MVDISLTHARKITLFHQGLFGPPAKDPLELIQQLSYVQIDTLAVVERAHQHTLWNRLKRYQPQQLDQLQQDGKIFEHWAHALAYLPMDHYRFSLPFMQRIAAGDTHWFKKDAKQCAQVLQRIRDEGPLSAKDFTDRKTSSAMWARSPSKRALEQLFMEGELMIPQRINFHKVYDLRERVLPNHVDTSTPTETELAQHLIHRFLQAHGFGSAKEIAYLRKGLGPIVKQNLSDLCEAGEVITVNIAGQTYYTTEVALELGAKRSPPKRLRILSPFDNLVIQRQRLAHLFQFDYQIECYLPQAKRQYGYFCLPILWGDEFIGRLDAKAERKTKQLQGLNLHLLPKNHLPVEALAVELLRFAQFNGCESVTIKRVSGLSRSLNSQVQKSLNALLQHP